jgi:hypothetical protein
MPTSSACMDAPASDEKRSFLSKSVRIVKRTGLASAPSSVELDARIARCIGGADGDDASFERLALDVFAYQYAENPAYRRYCARFSRAPSEVRHWEQIPAIPTSACAGLRLACFPPERARLTFISSGTTRGSRSRLELEDTSLYDASLLAHFRRCVLPDAPRMQVIALSPSFEDAPHSSLAYMLSKISQTLGTPDDAFFARDGRLDFEAASAALRAADAPTLVVGTAFAFVHFFDRCASEGTRFALPPGSRVVETGGFKGKSREVGRDELYGWFTQFLGVPRASCVSEYGMCELGSQWYDANLADNVAGRASRMHLKIGPHWTRTVVVDPVTAAPLPHGEVGLLQVFDLSNLGSVSAVLTGDLVRADDDGFELLGRGPGQPPKGCSIALDAALNHDGD